VQAGGTIGNATFGQVVPFNQAWTFTTEPASSGLLSVARTLRIAATLFGQ
jgi:hypothetical protein